MLCVKCKINKSPSFFNWKNKREGKRHTTCRECQKTVRRDWYERNREHAIAYSKQSASEIRNRNKAYVVEHLEAHPCEHCGEADPVVLEFHHLRDKETEICRMVTNGVSIRRLDNEIKKCQVLCANCHRRETARLRFESH